jgi:hypothetical protein
MSPIRARCNRPPAANDAPVLRERDRSGPAGHGKADPSLDPLHAMQCRPALTCQVRGGRPPYRRYRSDRECPLHTAGDRCLWHVGGTAGENDDPSHVAATASTGRRVRPVLGKPLLVGKPEAARQYLAPGRHAQPADAMLAMAELLESEGASPPGVVPGVDVGCGWLYEPRLIASALRVWAQVAGSRNERALCSNRGTKALNLSLSALK